jgi:hypothetical protein
VIQLINQAYGHTGKDLHFPFRPRTQSSRQTSQLTEVGFSRLSFNINSSRPTLSTIYGLASGNHLIMQIGFVDDLWPRQLLQPILKSGLGC